MNSRRKKKSKANRFLLYFLEATISWLCLLALFVRIVSRVSFSVDLVGVVAFFLWSIWWVKIIFQNSDDGTWYLRRLIVASPYAIYSILSPLNLLPGNLRRGISLFYMIIFSYFIFEACFPRSSELVKRLLRRYWLS